MSTVDLSTRLAQLTTDIAIATIDKVRHRQTDIAMAGIKARMKTDLRDNTIMGIFLEKLGSGDFSAVPGTPLEGTYLENSERHSAYVEEVSNDLSNTISEILSTGGNVLSVFNDTLTEISSNNCFTKVVNPDSYFDIQIFDHCPLLKNESVVKAFMKDGQDAFFKEGFQVDDSTITEIKELLAAGVSEEERFLTYFDFGDTEVLEGLAKMARTFDLTTSDFETIIMHGASGKLIFKDGNLSQSGVASFTRGYEEALICLIYYIKQARTEKEGSYRFHDLETFWAKITGEIIDEYQGYVNLGYIFNPITAPPGFVNKDFDFIGIEKLMIPVFETNLFKLYDIEGSSGYETILGITIDKTLSPFVKLSDLQEIKLHRFSEDWLEFREGFGKKERSNLNFLLQELYKETILETLRSFDHPLDAVDLSRLNSIVNMAIDCDMDQETLNSLIVSDLILDSPVAAKIFTVYSGESVGLNGDKLREVIIDIVSEFCMGMVKVEGVTHG